MMKEVVGQHLDRSSLPSEVELLKDMIIALKAESALLQEEIEVLKGKVFGHKSETSQKKVLKVQVKLPMAIGNILVVNEES